jgi:cell division protein FtsB
MKKSDIAMIILIASVSVLIAYFVAKAIIGDVGSQTVKVKTTDKITTDVKEPDTEIFNSNAINPTVDVIIGDKK